MVVDYYFVHVGLIITALIAALTLWTLGYNIRRGKAGTPPAVRAKRRWYHTHICPVFSTFLVAGFTGGLLNRYFLWGAAYTFKTTHAYFALTTIVLFTLGGVIGGYMALKKPSDLLRKVHMIVQTLGVIVLATTMYYGLQLAISLKLIHL